MATKETYTLKEQLAQAQGVAARSQHLWGHVNRHIVAVLASGIESHRGRQNIADRLSLAAGPKKKGEPACLCNYRSAANSVRTGGRVCLI